MKVFREHILSTCVGTRMKYTLEGYASGWHIHVKTEALSTLIRFHLKMHLFLSVLAFSPKQTLAL